MSTRSSIWLGESRGRTVHIYWELAERDIELGRERQKMAVPVYVAVDQGVGDDEVSVRLPKAIATEILKMLAPDWREGYEVI